MDADSSTGGLNDNSESGELDSIGYNDEFHFNTNSRDSSKQSINSERTNIDALDDTARDTIIVPPYTQDDSTSGSSSANLINNQNQLASKRLLINPEVERIKIGEQSEHDLLDFGEEIPINKEEGEQSEDEDEGELIDDEEVLSPGELGEIVKTNANLEDGEVDEDPSGRVSGRTKKIEETPEELEEGEVSDDEDRKKQGPVPICRFFGKGHCTWGTNCRFLHPGVIDKGLYTMFEHARPPPPQVPPSSAPHFPVGGPGPVVVGPPGKGSLLGIPPGFPVAQPPRLQPPLIETPWERAQRQAKELMKQSEIIKETDIDFEDKKMNLTLTQEEFDKENDYYVKKLKTPEREQPPEEEEINEWDLPSRISQGKIDPEFVRERVHHVRRGIRQAPPRDSIREAPPLHEPEVRMVRESALMKRKGSRFAPPPDETSPPPPVTRRSAYEARRRDGGSRGAEDWHDPWNRTNSSFHQKVYKVNPRDKRKGSSVSKRSRSYSSASSHSRSSSGGGRSSSRDRHSSKSSKSSRSRSRSANSKSSTEYPPVPTRRRAPPLNRDQQREDNHFRKAPPRRAPSPKPMRIAPPNPTKEGSGFVDRRYQQHGYSRPPRFAPPMSGMGASGLGIKEKQDVSRGMLRGNKRGHGIDWDQRSSSSRSRSRSWSKSPQPQTRRLANKRSKFSRSPQNKKRSQSWSRSSKSSSASRSPSPTSPIKRSSRSALDDNLDGGKRGPRMLDNRIGGHSRVKLEPSDDRKGRQGMLSSSQIGKGDRQSRVKMTLRPSGGIKPNKSILDKLADDVMGDDDDDENGNSEENASPTSSNEGGTSPKNIGRAKLSRREELLKQLQKVEEAIAKKRSKIL